MSPLRPKRPQQPLSTTPLFSGKFNTKPLTHTSIKKPLFPSFSLPFPTKEPTRIAAPQKQFSLMKKEPPLLLHESGRPMTPTEIEILRSNKWAGMLPPHKKVPSEHSKTTTHQPNPKRNMVFQLTTGKLIPQHLSPREQKRFELVRLFAQESLLLAEAGIQHQLANQTTPQTRIRIFNNAIRHYELREREKYSENDHDGAELEKDKRERLQKMLDKILELDEGKH